jgi:hypothetical protein
MHDLSKLLEGLCVSGSELGIFMYRDLKKKLKKKTNFFNLFF